MRKWIIGGLVVAAIVLLVWFVAKKAMAASADVVKPKPPNGFAGDIEIGPAVIVSPDDGPTGDAART